ncbi:MAG: nicotinate-nucleotide adenylyltransferase [Hyphomicrobiaceae bacterium]|nr:nicotinate-nucleotide adenylyltransferase [Hyphomicrobiaceae bacterium]
MPHAERAQRIGLLGGSFNPAHGAHVLITETAIKRLRLDRVWWLVSPGNPLKSRKEQAPLCERLARARSLARDTRVRVTAFEADLPTAFTASTLAFLRRRHPQPHFVWLMGADNLATIHHWRAWRSIFALMPVAVIDRPGWHLRALASPAARALARARLPADEAPTLPLRRPPAWVFLKGPLSDLSSTAIRSRSARGSPEA